VTNARVKRRLEAVLAADVVGYSRLVGFDEVGLLAALKVHRSEAKTFKSTWIPDAIRKTIAQHV
jgi:hypothetical protein